MSLNGVKPEGDDQDWKAEVERELAELRREIASMASLVDYLRGRA